MPSISELKKRVESLTKRHRAVLEKKTRYAGMLEEKKKELYRLDKEIREAGYDPKDLPAEKSNLETEIEGLIAKFEKELENTEKALDEYEQ